VWQSVEVERTVIHPAWLEAAERTPRVIVLGTKPPPDVALIVLTEESASRIDQLPITPIDPTPVSDGEPVWIMGYGCEQGVDAAVLYPEGNPRLKAVETATLAADSLIHDGMFIPAGRAGQIHGRYTVTAGKLLDETSASLCPGDSGGPVYRQDGAAIIGVNAMYSFVPRWRDLDRIAYTNWHTRLDDRTTFAIGAWLQQLGVTTTRTEARELNIDDPGDEGVPDGICGPLVINEISLGSDRSDKDEYIELYNPSDCGMGLREYSLRYSAGSTAVGYWNGTESDGIAPGGYFIIRGDDLEGPYHAALTSSGLRDGLEASAGVALFDAAGAQLDAVAWGDSIFGEGDAVAAIPAGRAAQRVQDGADSDDNAADFVVADRTPGSAF
jgi:hypothetical protein